MKTLLFVFASLFVLQCVSAKALQDTPKTCEDILTQDTCDSLRKIAAAFHEKATIVNEAIQAALAKHITSVKEVTEFVKDYLIEKATNFKCEDSLSAETCNKLREVAQRFHEQASTVTDAVKEAVAEHYLKAKMIIQAAREYLVAKATNFKCEDVLTADQCKQLVDFAAKFKVSTTALLQDLKEAVADGIVNAKDLITKAKEILLEKLSDFSCEKFVDADTCAKIAEFAKNVKASAQEQKDAIIDAYLKGLQNSKDILDDVKQYLKERVSCDQILGEDTCTKIQNLVQKTSIKFDAVMQKLREWYVSGIKSVGELTEKAMKYIMENVWPWGFNALSEDEVVQLLDMLSR